MRRPRIVHRAEPGQEPPRIPPIAIVIAVLAIVIIAGTLIATSGGGDDSDKGLATQNTPDVGTPVAVSPRTPVGERPRTPGAAVERLLFMSDRDGKDEIYQMNADGTGQTRLTSGSGVSRLPNALFDGSRIVFVSDRDTPNSSELYVMNGDGTSPTRLSAGDAPGPGSIKLESNFSADGRRIVFEIKRGDNYDVVTMNADGTGVQNLTNSPTADIDPVF